jgi:hypothetical protein
VISSVRNVNLVGCSVCKVKDGGFAGTALHCTALQAAAELRAQTVCEQCEAGDAVLSYSAGGWSGVRCSACIRADGRLWVGSSKLSRSQEPGGGGAGGGGLRTRRGWRKLAVPPTLALLHSFVNACIVHDLHFKLPLNTTLRVCPPSPASQMAAVVVLVTHSSEAPLCSPFLPTTGVGEGASGEATLRLLHVPRCSTCSSCCWQPARGDTEGGPASDREDPRPGPWVSSGCGVAFYCSRRGQGGWATRAGAPLVRTPGCGGRAPRS